MIIVTGGAGFIGSCLIAELNANGITDIVVVDQLGSSNKWKNIANKRISQFIHKDTFRYLFNKKPTPTKKIEAIIHLGACSDTTQTDVDYLMDNNFLYTKELFLFAKNNNIRFIYASSAATYGDGSNGYSDASINNLEPLNPYGFSKHLFDMYIMNNNYEEFVTGIKYFNVFGPNEYHKGNMRSMFVKSFEQIKETNRVKLFKSNDPKYNHGEQKRDFIYVKDCSKIIMKILNDTSFTGIYNVGTGKAESWNTLVNAVFKAMKKDVCSEYIDMPEHLAKQYQNFTQADTNKLLSKLGGDWTFTSIEEAADDYINNYLAKDNCIL